MAMNSDPSGTDADIPSGPDGDHVIDIFIFTKDARNSRQITGQLANEGYRITSFFDDAELLDRLRMGKPNLLICDATGPEKEGYPVCHDIKEDADLWNIPVLLITGVSSLGDLLIVLDSNADNFIALPWDAQYLVSLIELMLASPVEKPDPDKVRTQFKIRHEDQDYVITADRRKLLEFLLSSFEIAMNRATELDQVRGERNTLQSTLESRVAEKTRELTSEVARLQTAATGQSRELDSSKNALAATQREADALRTRIGETEKSLAAKADELARANEELEATRAHLAETEDTVRTLGAEKEELVHTLKSELDTANADLAQARDALAGAHRELDLQSSEHADLRQQLETRDTEYTETKKSLAAAVIEIGQLKSDLAGEKNRADTAEQEVKSILQEKAKSEEDLRQMIGDITAKAAQQSQEVLRLSDELVTEKKERESLEQDYTEFRQETAKKETGLVAERDTLAGHHDELQEKYDALTESLGAEREKAATKDADMARLAVEKRQLENDLLSAKGQVETLTMALDEEKRLRAGAELNAKNGIESKNDELRELAATIDTLRRDLDARGSELSLAGKERDDARLAHREACDRLAALELAKGQADKVARSAAAEMEQVREQLETERRLRHGAEETAAAAERTKENINQNLQATIEAAESAKRELSGRIDELSKSLENERAAKDSAAGQLDRAVTGLKEAARIADRLKDMESDLRTAQERQRSLEEQLRNCEREQAQKEAAFQSLTEDLGQISSTLATERDLRRAAEHAYEEQKEELAVLKSGTGHTLDGTPPAMAEEPALPAVIPGAAHHELAVREDPVHSLTTMEDFFEEPTELDIGDLPDAAPVPDSTRDGSGSPEVQDIPVTRGTLIVPPVRECGTSATTLPSDPMPEKGEDQEIHACISDDPDAGPSSKEELSETEDLPEGDETDSPLDENPDDEIPDESEDGDAEKQAGISGADTPRTGTTFSRRQWLDLIKWAHHAETLSREDRIRIVKLGRLIQQGRRLTPRQEEQLTGLVALAGAMGYRPKE
ncbi:response regulator [Methanoregula sp. UBA64]|jgi:DNA-binding response OmpR family regulator/predicted  nucleic acid-binding Zn-ribbon protein|uniref:response regulator n=1 Tax=Methanoregula sp. UBA64 TaxID=1915554 RepID=UPI0025CEF0C7|nr:response regulator [Methanoregula sp. UBA64]